MEKAKRTEDKLVFGLDRICTACKGKGKTQFANPCRLCGGSGIIREVPNGKG